MFGRQISARLDQHLKYVFLCPFFYEWVVTTHVTRKHLITKTSIHTHMHKTHTHKQKTHIHKYTIATHTKTHETHTHNNTHTHNTCYNFSNINCKHFKAVVLKYKKVAIDKDTNPNTLC